MKTPKWRMKQSIGFIFFQLLFFYTPLVKGDIQAEYLFDLEAGFTFPSALRISDQGRAYVLDGINDRVVIFDRNGKKLDEINAPAGTPFNLPMDLQLYKNLLIIADSGNHRLLLFTPEGKFLKALTLSNTVEQQPPEPTGLAVIDGVIYWSDRANSRICATALQSGNQLRCWGEFGTRVGEFRYPFMLSTDRDNYLYAVDVLNGRIQVFNERGRSFGAIERFGVNDKSLLRPNGISLGDRELLMVSDSYNGKIHLFNGRSFAGLLLDQAGNIVDFEQPVGIARWQDRLYVVEMGRHRVQVLRIKEQERPSKILPTAHFSQPIRRDCVTCHLSWSEEYQHSERETGPVLPVGSKKMCMSCHHGAVIDSRRSLGQGDQHPDYYHPAKGEFFDQDVDRDEPIAETFPLLEGNTPYCGACHTPHLFSEEETGLTHGRENLWMRADNQDSEICRHCHESLYAVGNEVAREKGIHPVSLDLDEAVKIDGASVERLNCQSCHRVHGAKSKSGLLVVNNENVGRLCATCHQRHDAESLEHARRKGVHPINVELDQAVTITDSEISRVDCLSCHAVHGGVEHTPSLVVDHRDARLCENCHEDTVTIINTHHDLRVSASESHNLLDESPSAAGVCGSCHTMHRGTTDLPYLSVGDQLPEGVESSHLARDRLCLSCHRDEGIGENSVINDYSHPYQDLVMHADRESMPLLDLDERSVSTGQIGCVTCHNPHVWSPRHAYTTHKQSTPFDKDSDGTVMDSFLRQEQIQESFCVVCHGLETRIKYKYYHDDRGRQNKADYLR
jgi:predicted CXXCH cytochrome family protein